MPHLKKYCQSIGRKHKKGRKDLCTPSSNPKKRKIMITTNNTSNKKIIMPDWKTQYLNRLTIYNIYIQKYNKALQQD